MNEDRPVLSAAVGSVDFGDVQVVHKFASQVTPNLDFKGTPLFDVEISQK